MKNKVLLVLAGVMVAAWAEGLAGAIDTTSQAKMAVERLVVNPTEINADGSFRMQLEAEAGDKIVVRARNLEGKKSRGTFTVPAEGIMSEPEQTETKKGKKVKKHRRLAVIIKVFDVDSGKTVAQKQFEWSQWVDKARRSIRISHDIVNKCMKTVKEELIRAKAKETKKKDKEVLPQTDESD